MKEQRKVSIIIPTYKRAEKLGRAIDSVLNQTYKNIEVIVVDDNAEGDVFREKTSEFMKKYAINKNVVYIKHKLNKNGSAARNTGIKHSKGEFIGFLDDDDYFETNKIALQVDKFKTLQGDYGGVCCEHYARYKFHIYKKDSIDVNPSGNYVYDLLSGRTVLAAGSTLLVKKDVFKIIGLFDESYQRHQDYEFLLRFFRKYKLLIVKKPLVNITVDGIRNYPKASFFEKIKQKFLTDFEDDINNLGQEQRKHVIFTQWSEVFLYYIGEFDFKSAKELYNRNMKPMKLNLGTTYYLKVIYLLIERKIFFMKPLKYRFVALILKIRRF